MSIRRYTNLLGLDSQMLVEHLLGPSLVIGTIVGHMLTSLLTKTSSFLAVQNSSIGDLVTH